YGRSRAFSWRIKRARFCEAHQRAEDFTVRLAPDCAPDRFPRHDRGPGGPRAVGAREVQPCLNLVKRRLICPPTIRRCGPVKACDWISMRTRLGVRLVFSNACAS